MKKIKCFITFVLTGIIAFIGALFSGQAVCAESTLVFKADDRTETQLAANTVLVDNENLTVTLNYKAYVYTHANPEGATSEDGLLNFKKLLFTSIANDETPVLVITAKAGTRFGFYYTIASGDIDAANSKPNGTNSKDGAPVIVDAEDNPLTQYENAKKSYSIAQYHYYDIYEDSMLYLKSNIAQRLAIFGITYEPIEVVNTFDITVMDGQEELVKFPNQVEGTEFTYVPTKFGYDFDSYYLDEALETPLPEAYQFTTDTVLYTKFTKWEDGIVKANHLDGDFLAKMDDNYDTFDSDVVATDTIFTFKAGTRFETQKGDTCLNTAGSLTSTTSAVRGIQIDVKNAGYIRVLATVGSSSKANEAILQKNVDGVRETVTCYSGNPTWTVEEAPNYERKYVTWKVEAGTYYLGGETNLRIFDIQFSSLFTDLSQFDNTSSIRYVCTLSSLEAQELADVKVTINLTLDGQLASIDIPTVYTHVTDLEQYAQKDGTYYVVYTLSGLDTLVDDIYVFAGKELTCQIVVEYNGEVISSNEVTHTISDFA